ncbi:MAG: acyl-coenzyme A:6-aminopenicillanic acid acyl-transferase family protein, partial [Clostridiales bacterium]|nr:acyl-coenzyme A:6-aminopenicillanic acid acyl-transferase family protein [Clostridiales bacterium]
LINELPISSYCNLIIADKYNHAVLAEISNSTKIYKRITPDTEDSYLCSTNHYTLDGMQGYVRNRMQHSLDRYNVMTKVLDREEKNNKEELRDVLSKHMPEGLACHYYEDVLGTLWAMLFDVTNIEADICFGSPVLNKWHKFSFDCNPGVTEYKAQFSLEKSNPNMWKRV